MRARNLFAGTAVLAVLSACQSHSAPLPPTDWRAAPVEGAEYEAFLEPVMDTAPTPDSWEYQRPSSERCVEIRTCTVPVHDAWVRSLFEGQNAIAFTADRASTRALLCLLEDGAGVPVTKSTLAVGDGSSGTLRNLSQQNFVRGYRYAGGPGRKLADPQVGVAEEGEVLRLSGSVESERSVSLDLELVHRELESSIAQVVTHPRPGESMPLQLPIVRRERIHAKLCLDLDRTLILRRPGFRDGEWLTFVEARIETDSGSVANR